MDRLMYTGLEKQSYCSLLK